MTIYQVSVCVRETEREEREGTCHEDQRKSLRNQFFCHIVESRALTQVVRPGYKLLYLMSHLADLSLLLDPILHLYLVFISFCIRTLIAPTLSVFRLGLTI